LRRRQPAHGAFGPYRRSQIQGAYIVRVILAPAVGIPLAFLGAQLLPGPVAADDKWLLALTLALVDCCSSATRWLSARCSCIAFWCSVPGPKHAWSRRR
jgi:hypothetical protein